MSIIPTNILQFLTKLTGICYLRNMDITLQLIDALCNIFFYTSIMGLLDVLLAVVYCGQHY